MVSMKPSKGWVLDRAKSAEAMEKSPISLELQIASRAQTHGEYSMNSQPRGAGGRWDGVGHPRG